MRLSAERRCDRPDVADVTVATIYGSWVVQLCGWVGHNAAPVIAHVSVYEIFLAGKIKTFANLCDVSSLFSLTYRIPTGPYNVLLNVAFDHLFDPPKHFVMAPL